MQPHKATLSVLAASALTLAACGTTQASSKPPSGGTPTATAGGASAATAGGGLPGIGKATDLKVEPTISPSSTPAPSKLLTRDLVVGHGAVATPTSTVVVQYVGANYKTGKVFDSSWQRGQAASLPLSQMLPGFAQGVSGMKVGGRREIVIPASLGYGPAGNPPVIGPNETLVFVVDLTSVK